MTTAKKETISTVENRTLDNTTETWCGADAIFREKTGDNGSVLTTDDACACASVVAKGTTCTSNGELRRRLNARQSAGRANRSSQKSLRCMRTALATLLQTRPFGEISVEELTGMADLSRGTFYRHFGTTRELLDETLAVPLTVVRSHVMGLAAWMNPASPRQFIVMMLECAGSDKAMLREFFFVDDGGNQLMLACRLLDSIVPAATAVVCQWTLKDREGEDRAAQMAMTRSYVIFVGMATLDVVSKLVRETDEGTTATMTATDGRFARGLVDAYNAARIIYLE